MVKTIIFCVIAVLVLGLLSYVTYSNIQLQRSVDSISKQVKGVDSNVINADTDVQDVQTKADSICSALNNCY